MQGLGLDWMILDGPFQIRKFCDSLIHFDSPHRRFPRAPVNCGAVLSPLTFSLGKICGCGASLEPGGAAGAAQRAVQWKIQALSHPSHTCELLREAGTAAVPFERAVHQQGCHFPLSGGTKAHTAVSALAGSRLWSPSWVWRQLGDALSPAIPAWGRAAGCSCLPEEPTQCQV